MTADTVDRTIRNRRPSHWAGTAVLLTLGLFWLGVCGLLLTKLPPRYPFAFAAVVVPLVIGSGFVVPWLMTRQTLDRVKLGNHLDALPRGLYSPRDVERIEFGPDPHEDYIDSPTPVPLCEATIALTCGAPIRLIVGPGDAARLREWAERHGIAVNDPHGYSTGVTAPRPGAAHD
jgi:hypothetical protein